MTRQEFIDDITTFAELKEFCYDHDCELLDDVYDQEQLDDEINAWVDDNHRDYMWNELRDYFDNIPTGYDYYRQTDVMEYEGLDHTDFQLFKNEVLEWSDDNEVWDEDEENGEDADGDFTWWPFDEEDEPEEEKEEEEELVVEDEDFGVGELFAVCIVSFSDIVKEQEEREREDAEAFSGLVAAYASKNAKL